MLRLGDTLIEYGVLDFFNNFDNNYWKRFKTTPVMVLEQRYQNTLGQWLERKYQLWNSASELRRWFISQGVEHMCDMSLEIMLYQYGRLNHFMGEHQ
ncbi:MAG: hypothetical protein PVI90_00485 [Desulfobacteraceae bacterium]|jgi:hypothetical protein